ncbi:peptidase inhibitor family I36 protein [Saccharomonospora sp. NPDC006951]
MAQFFSLSRSRVLRAATLTALAFLGGAGSTHASTPATKAPPPEFACAQGEFCAWAGEFYAGGLARLDLRDTNPGECVTLPKELEAHSFANRIDRHVTVYQDSACATEGDFTTYPGPGTFVPRAPFVVRAVQIWD